MLSSLERTLLIVLSINLAISPLFYDIFNLYSHEIVGNLLISGRNPVSVIVWDPPLIMERPTSGAPLAIYFVAFAYLLSRIFDGLISFAMIIKYLLTMCSVITVLYLFKTLKLLGSNEREASNLSLLFALNPIILLSVQVHTLLDIIAIMFVIISIYHFLLYINNGKDREAFFSSLSLGAAIAIRFYPAILLPIFLIKLRKNFYYLMPAFLLPVLFSLPFLTDFEAYLTLILRPFGGTTPLIKVAIDNLAFILMIALLLYTYWHAYIEKQDVIKSSFLATFALNIGMGVFLFAYFSWTLPFLILLAFVKKIKYYAIIPLALSMPLLFWTFTIGGIDWPAGATGFSYYMIHLFKPIVLRLEYPFIFYVFNALAIICGIIVFYLIFLVIQKNRKKQ
jgi:hypothetical protein